MTLAGDKNTTETEMIDFEIDNEYSQFLQSVAHQLGLNLNQLLFATITRLIEIIDHIKKGLNYFITDDEKPDAFARIVWPFQIKQQLQLADGNQSK